MSSFSVIYSSRNVQEVSFTKVFLNYLQVFVIRFQIVVHSLWDGTRNLTSQSSPFISSWGEGLLDLTICSLTLILNLCPLFYYKAYDLETMVSLRTGFFLPFFRFRIFIYGKGVEVSVTIYEHSKE